MQVESHTTTEGTLDEWPVVTTINGYSENDMQLIHLEFYPALYDAQLSRPHHKSITMDFVIKNCGKISSKKELERTFQTRSVCMSKRCPNDAESFVLHRCISKIHMDGKSFTESGIPATSDRDSSSVHQRSGLFRNPAARHASWVGLVWTLGFSGRKQDSS